MAPTPPPPPRAAKPTKEIFDPFNSSATGHQRAENRLSGSTLWRHSRQTKLVEQFSSGAGGGKRVADTVGAGSDGSRKMGLLPNGTVTWFREDDQLSLQESMKVRKRTRDGEDRKAKRVKVEEDTPPEKDEGVEKVTPPTTSKAETDSFSPSNILSPIDPNSSFSTNPPASQEKQEKAEEVDKQKQAKPVPKKTKPKQIFANLVVYINGSTAPLVSDHKLKRILTEHGARVSIALGRRSVTHVILARPGSKGGFGGGALAGSKIQKEVVRKRGESVKYVTAEWVLDSVKAGKRLPESRFEALRLASKGMGSVRKMFGKVKETVDDKVTKDEDG